MKISLCIPQYNRIEYLKKNLSIIERQSYPDMEITISDDASTDNTEAEIEKLKASFRYPVKYFRHARNVGYDANLRKSLEMASGDYCFILGNDDTLNLDDGIGKLASFLEQQDFPEIGFCNYVEDHSPEAVIERAFTTGVIGTGKLVALKYYRAFSYVAGIIVKRSSFEAVNTNKADGSIFVQMYLAARIITNGGRFFMYRPALVKKDIRIDGSMANSYRDTLMKKWSELKPIDGGLKNVIWAVTEGFKDSGDHSRKTIYAVLKNIYWYSYTYWLLDYRSNGSFVGAYALSRGMLPRTVPQVQQLDFFQRVRIKIFYFFFTGLGLFTPVFFFQKLKLKIYRLIKK